jgi:hypothetical protein
VDPRAVLDAVVNTKILNPRRESNPRTPNVYILLKFNVPQSALDQNYITQRDKYLVTGILKDLLHLQCKTRQNGSRTCSTKLPYSNVSHTHE